MAQQREKWSVTTGPLGARVTAGERVKGGLVYLYAYDRTIRGRRKRSLGFRVRDAEGKLIPSHVTRARQEALELSNRLIQGDGPSANVTIDLLFRLFEREVVPGLGKLQQRGSQREMDLWRTFLRPQFVVSRFGMHEWNGLMRARQSGEIDARGRPVVVALRAPVGARSVAKSLKLFRQACRFGVNYRVPTGGCLLQADPTRGLPIPVERNPKRPVVDSERFQKLLDVADRVKMAGGLDGHRVRSYLRDLIVIAEGTGRRISAILALRCSDWDGEAKPFGTLKWRAEHDKVGRDWTTPVTPDVREAVERLRTALPVVGDRPMFALPFDPTRAVTRHQVVGWLRQAERLSGLIHMPGGGFHAFRRAWASKRKHLSVVDVAAAGGWIDTSTLLRCYQQPDAETIEAVVMGGKQLRMVR